MPLAVLIEIPESKAGGERIVARGDSAQSVLPNPSYQFQSWASPRLGGSPRSAARASIFLAERVWCRSIRPFSQSFQQHVLDQRLRDLG